MELPYDMGIVPDDTTDAALAVHAFTAAALVIRRRRLWRERVTFGLTHLALAIESVEGLHNLYDAEGGAAG